MPTSAQMLEELALAAARMRALAIGWHVVIALVFAAIVKGWRPSGRVAGALLASICMSVAVVALSSSNPFNAAVFGALAVGLAVASMRDRSPIEPRLSVAGVAALAFGWIYPHFVDFPAWLYASPIGVVPCATLYVLGGATLAGFAPQSAAFRWIAGIAALFYGAFGVLRLGVWIDLGLVGVHAMCIHEAHALHRSRRAPPHELPSRKDVRAAVGVGAKFDDHRANGAP